MSLLILFTILITSLPIVHLIFRKKISKEHLKVFKKNRTIKDLWLLQLRKNCKQMLIHSPLTANSV